MEQKTKIIIIGLVALLVMSLFFAFQATSSRQGLIYERDSMKKELEALRAKAQESEDAAQRLQSKLASLNDELQRAVQEKGEFAKKFDTMSRERDDLLDKIKELKERPSAAATPAPVSYQPASLTDDSYWAGVLKAKTDLEIQIGSLRDDLKSAFVKADTLQREKAGLELEVSNLSRDKQDLERQLEYNQKLMDNLARDLVVEKNDKMSIQDSLKPYKAENEMLRRQLKNLESRKAVLEAKLLDFQKQNQDLEARADEMDTLLKSRVTQIDTLKRQVSATSPADLAASAPASSKKSVELPPIVVKPQNETAAEEANASGVADLGKVVAINRDNNFVIIDLGQESGIKVGDRFQVFRQEKPVGKVEVIQIRRSISACDIKKESTPIKVGDTIR